MPITFDHVRRYITDPNFPSWEKKGLEHRYCEGLLRSLYFDEENLNTLRSGANPPDIIVSLGNNESLGFEVTRFIPYNKAKTVKIDRLVDRIRDLAIDHNVSPKWSSEVWVHLPDHSDDSKKISEDVYPVLGETLRSFFQNLEIKDQNILLRITKEESEVTLTYRKSSTLNPSGQVSKNHKLGIINCQGTKIESVLTRIESIVEKKGRFDKQTADVLVIGCSSIGYTGIDELKNHAEVKSLPFDGIYIVFLQKLPLNNAYAGVSVIKPHPKLS